MKLIDEYLQDIEEPLRSPQFPSILKKSGWLMRVRDGVALVTGLDNVTFGEVVQFASGVKGYVIDLLEDKVGVVVLGDYLPIKSSEQVKALGYTLSVPVSEGILGRVVDPLCNPQDSLPAIRRTECILLRK